MVYFEICLLQLIGDLFIVIGLIGNVFIVISLKNGSQIVLYKINVSEYRRDNKKWTIQRNRQHRVYNTQDKAKTQRTMC